MSYISITQARQMISLFKELKPGLLSPGYPQSTLPNCETFSKSELEHIFEVTGCQQFRVYSGMDENNQVRSIIVGVNDDGVDIVPEDGEDNLILISDERCPDICPPNSPINP